MSHDLMVVHFACGCYPSGCSRRCWWQCLDYAILPFCACAKDASLPSSCPCYLALPPLPLCQKCVGIFRFFFTYFVYQVGQLLLGNSLGQLLTYKIQQQHSNYSYFRCCCWVWLGQWNPIGVNTAASLQFFAAFFYSHSYRHTWIYQYIYLHAIPFHSSIPNLGHVVNWQRLTYCVLLLLFYNVHKFVYILHTMRKYASRICYNFFSLFSLVGAKNWGYKLGQLDRNCYWGERSQENLGSKQKTQSFPKNKKNTCT